MASLTIDDRIDRPQNKLQVKKNTMKAIKNHVEFYENGHFGKRTIHNETDPRSLYSGY